MSFKLHLGYRLRRVSNHALGTLARTLRSRHTSVAEWVVLCHILERPGITTGGLAETLAMTHGAVSKIIDKLVAKNWAARLAKPGDGRAQLLFLTQLGSRILPRLAELADQNERKLFDCLEVGERATLGRLLNKLARLHQIGDGHTRDSD